MIGRIIFGFGIGIFLSALGFWIFYLVKANRARRESNFKEELFMTRSMTIAGLLIAVGALITNIGNIIIQVVK